MNMNGKLHQGTADKMVSGEAGLSPRWGEGGEAYPPVVEHHVGGKAPAPAVEEEGWAAAGALAADVGAAGEPSTLTSRGSLAAELGAGATLGGPRRGPPRRGGTSDSPRPGSASRTLARSIRATPSVSSTTPARSTKSSGGSAARGSGSVHRESSARAGNSEPSGSRPQVIKQVQTTTIHPPVKVATSGSAAIQASPSGIGSKFRAVGTPTSSPTQMYRSVSQPVIVPAASSQSQPPSPSPQNRSPRCVTRAYSSSFVPPPQSPPSPSHSVRFAASPVQRALSSSFVPPPLKLQSQQPQSLGGTIVSSGSFVLPPSQSPQSTLRYNQQVYCHPVGGAPSSRSPSPRPVSPTWSSQPRLASWQPMAMTGGPVRQPSAPVGAHAPLPAQARRPESPLGFASPGRPALGAPPLPIGLGGCLPAPMLPQMLAGWRAPPTAMADSCAQDHSFIGGANRPWAPSRGRAGHQPWEWPQAPSPPPPSPPPPREDSFRGGGAVGSPPAIAPLSGSHPSSPPTAGASALRHYDVGGASAPCAPSPPRISLRGSGAVAGAPPPPLPPPPPPSSLLVGSPATPPAPIAAHERATPGAAARRWAPAVPTSLEWAPVVRKDPGRAGRAPPAGGRPRPHDDGPPPPPPPRPEDVDLHSEDRPQRGLETFGALPSYPQSFDQSTDPTWLRPPFGAQHQVAGGG